MKHLKLFEQFLRESAFVDMVWGGYKRVMKASEGSEGLEPSKDGIIPMYLYWMSKYRADKSGKYTKLAMEIEKKGIKLQPMSDERDGTDNWKITIS